MPNSTPGADRARIVTGLLRDGDRILLGHRSPGRRWCPDVWDLPGGHVEAGEIPAEALARELHEELGIRVVPPVVPPVLEVDTESMCMQVWLIQEWTGTPRNVAPDEHDAIAWFGEKELGALSLAHRSYPALFTALLTPPSTGVSAAAQEARRRSRSADGEPGSAV